MADPTPFEIASAGEVVVADNGSMTVTMFAPEGGRLFKRRAVKVQPQSPAAEQVLPKLNQLAGDLLHGGASMTPADVAVRLRALADEIKPADAEHFEWAVAELDGVRAYCDGKNVIVTRQDLYP